MKVPAFKETEESLLCSQQPRSEPVSCSPQHHKIFLEDLTLFCS
jgi:hypothetical protein